MFVLCDIVGSKNRLVVDKSGSDIKRLQRTMGSQPGYAPPQAIVWTNGVPPKHGEALKPWKHDGDIQVVESERELGLPRYDEGDMEEQEEKQGQAEEQTFDEWTPWLSQGDLAEALDCNPSAIWKAANGNGQYKDQVIESRDVDPERDADKDLHGMTKTLYRARPAKGEETMSRTEKLARKVRKLTKRERDLKGQLLAAEADIGNMEATLNQKDDRIEHLEDVLDGAPDASTENLVHDQRQEIEQEMINILWAYLEGERPDRGQVGAVLRAYYGEVAA